MGNKERNDTYNKCIKKLEELGFEPKTSKSSLTKWINGEKTDFGDSLCISNIDSKKAGKACAEVNKVIKSYGGKLKADNYNTVFLSIKESSVMKEDASLVLSASFLTFMAILANADNISAVANKISGGKSKYIALDKNKKTINKNTYGYDDEKKALVSFAYYSLNLKSLHDDAIAIDRKNSDTLQKKVYLYKYNDKKSKLIFSGTFDEACKKYDINYKELDTEELKKRRKIYQDTLKKFKSLLASEKKLYSKGEIGISEKEDLEKFYKGTTDSADIYYCSLWDLIPNARNASNEELNAVFGPLEKIENQINRSLPKGYKISNDGDWDDILYVLSAPSSIKESYGIDENFLNRNSRPVKNAKAHYTFLKKKQAANKTNGATDQKEMPKYNSISASGEIEDDKKDEPIEELLSLTEAEIELLCEASDDNKKPIFIVTSYTNTNFGKVITTYTHAKYSHASLSFDSSLKHLYSFNANNGTRKLGGISLESIDGYIETYQDASISVSCIFVKEDDFEKIQNVLNKMLENKNHTMYGYSNLLNIIFKRSKEMSSDAMSMVCSQFVAYILSRADIHVVNKSDNLVTPKDLANISNPKVYKLYEGYARMYDQKKIDRIFRKLRKKAEYIKEQFCI